MMDLKKSFLKLFFSRAGKLAVGFAGMAYFANVLGAGPLGVFFLFEALLSPLSIVADFGIRSAVEKRLSEGNDPDAFLGSAVVLKLVIVALLAMLVLLFRGEVNAYIGENVALYVVLILFLKELFRLSVFALRGELRVGETATLQFFQHVGWVAFGVLLVRSGYGVVSLLYAYVISYGLMFVWGMYKLDTRLGKPSIQKMKNLVSFSKHVFIATMSGAFHNWADVIIIGFFLANADVGVYEIAWQVSVAVAVFYTPITTTLFPQISAWDNEGSTDQIESLVSETIALSLVLVIPSFVGVLIIGEDILGLVFGSEFVRGSTVLVVLMATRLLVPGSLLLDKVLTAVERPDLAAKSTAAGLLGNTVLNVFLILNFGILGATIGTFVGFLITVSFNFYYTRGILTLSPPYKQILWYCLSAGVMGVVVVSLKSVVGVTTVPVLFVVILTGAIVYGVCLVGYAPIRRKLFSHTRDIVADA